MRIRITMPNKDGKKLKEKVLGMADEGGVEEDEMTGEEWEVVSSLLTVNRQHAKTDVG